MNKKRLTFEEWLAKLDAFVWSTVGCSLDDLPDVTTRDWWEAGMGPKAAAVLAVANAKEGM